MSWKRDWSRAWRSALPGIRFGNFAAHYRLHCFGSGRNFSIVTNSSEIFLNPASIRDWYLFGQTRQHSAAPQ